jgi:iron(III) transport system ATP-binding protein
MSGPMLKIEDLTVRFGGEAVVRNVSFDVGRGELVCLLGPSGCGKTTTLRAIAGLERPDEGSVRIDDKVVSGRGVFVPPQKRGIGFLFQDFALFPHLTVAQNIAYGISAAQNSKEANRTQELLERVRLTKHADKYPHMLSGGQQQRVALVRALAARPRVVLLDEPFSGLDASLRGGLRDHTIQILKDANVTVVMVTHDPEEAMLSADRIILMRDGEIVQTGTPNELYGHPVDPFTASFFGDINRLEGRVEGEWIKTRLGRIANPGHPEGSLVVVLIRPDGLTLLPPGQDSDGPSEEVRICSVQHAGRSNIIRVENAADTKHDMHFHARTAGPFQVNVGEHYRVRIDRDQTFIFGAEDERGS